MSQQRYDIGQFRKAYTTPQGFLKADAYATRVGIFKYLMPDGSIRKELRPSEEVFKSDSLKSLSEVPVTNNHPPELVTADNSKKFSVGFTGESVERDDRFVKVGLTVTDSEAIKQMTEDRKLETSCGYTCDIEEIPGEFKGERYDAIQKNIVYNHLAIVNRGRAGPEVRVRLDSNSAVMVEEDNSKKSKGDDMSVKIKLDSIEYEVQDSGLAKAITEKVDALEKLTKEHETLKGKYDALESDVKKKDQEIKGLKAKAPSTDDLMKMAEARMDLMNFSKSILGDEFKFDGLSDFEIKKAVIEANDSELKMDGKSEDYINGCFDMIRENFVARNDDHESLKQGFKQKTKEPGTRNDAKAAADKWKTESLDAWKQPIGAQAN